MGSLTLIPTEKILERLRYENPWWVNKQIPDMYNAMAKRLYFSLFYPFVIEKKNKKGFGAYGAKTCGQNRHVVSQHRATVN